MLPLKLILTRNWSLALRQHVLRDLRLLSLHLRVMDIAVVMWEHLSMLHSRVLLILLRVLER
jgi:hypothetical protein